MTVPPIEVEASFSELCSVCIQLPQDEIPYEGRREWYRRLFNHVALDLKKS